jgi:hypothetical protein
MSNMADVEYREIEVEDREGGEADGGFSAVWGVWRGGV